MRPTMTAETLHDYLSSAHATVMLCRAHADLFDLDPEQVTDAHWRIELHIVELEGLREDLATKNAAPVPALDNRIVKFPKCC